MRSYVRFVRGFLGVCFFLVASGARADVPVANGDRVKSVQKKPFAQAGRLSLEPAASVSVSDPYWQHVGGGARLGWHVAEALTLEASALAFAALPTEDLRIAKRELHSQIVAARTAGLATADAVWAPAYGKVALGSRILHFELYALAGAGAAFTGAASGGPLTARPALDLGGGERLFFSDSLALRVGVAAHFYPTTVDVGGAPLSRVVTLVEASAALAIYFPAAGRAEAP